MPHKTSALCAVLAVTSLTTGCTHHQLQHNTVNQAETVADVHTRQVLDNLAKFAENPNALPHFSWPNAGAADVSDRLAADTGFNLTPHTLAGWMFGVGGSRTSGEAYTMTPINDPRKLELMRCAYQRAVASCSECGGYESGHCPNCQKRFNNFYLGESAGSKIKKLTSNGNPISNYGGVEVYSYQDELDRTKYRYVLTGAEVENINVNELKQLYVSNSVAEHTVRSGKVTANCLHGECWFEVGSKLNIPKHLHHNAVGRYGNTCVWVDDCGQDKLTQLTLTILDIALNDPPPSRTKEVVVYLSDKNTLGSRNESAYKVTATIPFSADIETVVPSVNAADASQDVSNKRAMLRLRSGLDNNSKAGIQKMLGLQSLNPAAMTDQDIAALAEKIRSMSDAFSSLSASAKSFLLEIVELDEAITKSHRAERDRRAVAAERKALQTLPSQHTPVPNAGYLQFQQNLRTLTP